MTIWIDTHDKDLTLVLFSNETMMDKIEKKDSFSHSEITIPSLIELLEKNNVTLDEIDDIVVVNGPGSFTGVRIGVTIAKTIAFTLKKPIRTITSLECLLTKDLTNGKVGLKEKNGYYIGTIKDGELINYEYLKKSEDVSDVLFKEDIDYEYIVKKVHQKEPMNPHVVNPFYVKKIEVEQ